MNDDRKTTDATQLIVEALRARGWILKIDSPERADDATVIEARGVPRRYIAVDSSVVSLNQAEEIGGDITIESIVLSDDSFERAAQVREIATWFG